MKNLFVVSVLFIFAILVSSCNSSCSKSGRRSQVQAQTPPETPDLISQTLPVSMEKDFPMPNIGEALGETAVGFIRQNWQVAGLLPGEVEGGYLWIAYPLTGETADNDGFMIQFEPDLPLEDAMKIAGFCKAYERDKENRSIIYYVFFEHPIDGHIHKDIMNFMNAVSKNLGREKSQILDWQ